MALEGMKMNLIFLGPPGAGKGTQAFSLAQILKIPHISTGDIFRENIGAHTELGVMADSYISKGELVPDDITVRIVFSRLDQEDCRDGFILDGFPRTIPQAVALEQYLAERKSKIDWIINIVISEDEIVKRLSKRRVCPKCNASYHMDFNPANGSLCNFCGTEIVPRADDDPAVVRSRIAAYHKKTEPLVEFYRNRGKLLNIKSENDVDESLKNTLYAMGMGNLV